MDLTITIGNWLFPLIATAVALVWLFTRDYSGDYNFNAVFYLPVAAFAICFSWMVYFGLSWAFT